MTPPALFGLLAALAIGCPDISREFSGAVSCSLHCPSRSNIGRPTGLILDIDGDGNLDAVELVCPVGKGVSRLSEVPVYLPVFSDPQMDTEAAHAPKMRVDSVFTAPGESNLLAVIFGSSPKKFRATARKALIERTWSLGVVHLERLHSPLKDWTAELGNVIPAPKPRGEPIIVRAGEVSDAIYWDGEKFRFHPQWEW
ncbi:MAG: hypothetical protein KJZ79_13385 [Bryobacteraceae bacterium]|nr:hypothetical protein [Bryobacteraceae bacterium]